MDDLSRFCCQNSACPDDAKQGDNWDHVALDPEHRLVVSVVPGKRTAEKSRNGDAGSIDKEAVN